MGKLTLYGFDSSPPVRACLLTLKALNLPFEYVQINFMSKDQLSPEYLAKNPQHTVPTLEDDGNFMWDSHAIIAYLVRKYGEDDALYPKDYLQRAVVDQRLHFESGVIYTGALRPLTVPVLVQNVTEVPQSKIDAVSNVYEMLETFLKDNEYMCGDSLTIADFSIITTVTSLEGFVNICPKKHPKLKRWLKRMQQLPYYQEANGKGAEKLVGAVKSKNITIVP